MRVIAGLRRHLEGLLARLDAAVNRLYTWRFNPLYHSGGLAVAAMVVLTVTGLYLLIFYRIGSPYESVAAITAQNWSGRWIRGLHRYASDVAVVAILLHAARMFVQRRTWGPRTLAWVSGLVLALAVLVCGWTGYVMLWDTQAQLLAVEGARLLDALPLFTEPIGRAFTGEHELPAAFFFLNLFAHIALPVGLALVLWIHVSRLARPALLPPRGLWLGALVVLLALSVAWPVTMAPEADLFGVPDRVPVDVFYGFFLPLTRSLPAWAVWFGGVALAGAVVAIPWLTRPADERRPSPSVVAERFCTGCEQCYVDCPYEAISMVARSDGRAGLVARVEPSRCVSCGICAGSCAPMGVGPPGRTGRDQLDEIRTFMEVHAPGGDDVVVIACDRSVARGPASVLPGGLVFPVACAGSLHTSVVELLLRSGTGGVLIASCPPRDCWNREGVTWLDQRLYHDREAELKARVDRDRLRVVHAGAGEPARVEHALAELREDLERLARAEAEATITLDTDCVRPEDPGLVSAEVEP